MTLAWESPFDISPRLLARGLVGNLDIAQARKEERETGRLLEEILLERGVIEEEQLARFFGDEYGYPCVTEEDLRRSTPGDEVLGAIPARLARSALLLPLSATDAAGSLDLAVAFPSNRSVLDTLRTFGRYQRLCLAIATPSALRRSIEEAYPTVAPKSRDPGRRSRGRRVMVAEPDEETRRQWRALLERAGHSVTETDSPATVADRLKVSDCDLVVARYGRDWKDYAAIAESAKSTEVRFVTDPQDALCGEVVPYPAMGSFLFATLNAIVRLFGQTHGVPADAILGPPRIVRAVAETLGLPLRRADELQLAAFLSSVAAALRQDAEAFAAMVEQATSSPLRVQAVVRDASLGEDRRPATLEGRILRLVFKFLAALKGSGEVRETVRQLRETLEPEDGPVFEALVTAFHRDRVSGLSLPSRRGEALIVNHREEDSRTWKMALRNAGFEVRVVADGQTAEMELTVSPPDLLITSAAIPGTDGYSLCQRAKSLFGVRSLLVSDLASNEFARLRALAVGADGYFGPPLDVRALVARAQELVASTSSPRSSSVRCAGSLAQLEPGALFAMLGVSQARVLVHLCSRGRLARFRVEAGAITPAAEAPGIATHTLDEALGWADGTFTVFGEAPPAALEGRR